VKSVIYAAIAVAAAAAGFALYRFGIAPHTQIESTQAMPPASDPVPVPEASDIGSPIPTVLPEFALPDRQGNRTSIRSWSGKSMIVNFWATWCGPCRREIPLLKAIQKQHGAAGFQVVGVAVDFRDEVLKYADEMKIDYPILIGEQEGLDAVNLFGLQSIGFPFTVFTDNQGRIVLTHLGELTKAQSAVMLDAVTRVNSGEFTPAHARTVVAGQLAKLTTS
jgi:thiol-disulfide isomerase/thioredoxin